MNKLLTTTQAADVLGISRRRVQQMTVTPCPVCRGEGCKRCKQTGFYLPWQAGGSSGSGTIKLIPQWAMELADVQRRPSGRPPGLPNIALEQIGEGHYNVTATLPNTVMGEVQRIARHRWQWRGEGMEGEEPTREAAITALLLNIAE